MLNITRLLTNVKEECPTKNIILKTAETPRSWDFMVQLIGLSCSQWLKAYWRCVDELSEKCKKDLDVEKLYGVVQVANI